MSLRTDLCGTLGLADVDRRVAVCGWVHRRREHGEHLAFVDVRDHSGVIQCVVDGAHDLRSEYVVRVQGKVRRRPEGTENPELPTGEVELHECDVEVLNPAEAPPIPLDERVDTDEVVRLRYRYVDLRKPRMQRNLRIRAAVNSALRASMERQGFAEVETPLLWTPTPEGAREFLVPSRLRPGEFYVLPQSPQIAKQVLMVSGLDRYYQVARCLRDEDLRADRQFEFTQLDLEASFVDEDDVLGAVADAVLDAAEAARGERPGEVPRLTWHEAMDRYGTDKPDLRFGMELIELTPHLRATEFRAFRAACVKGMRVPGGGELGRNRLDALVERATALGAKGLVWMRVEGEGAVASPVAKFLTEDELSALRTALDAEPGDLLLIVADDDRRLVQSVLGQLRVELGRPPVTEGGLRFLWVTEFPLFEGVDDAGTPIPAHHPFTMPHPDDLDRLRTDPLAVRSLAYDLVLNGWELGSGSIRIHRGDVQREVFAALGISDAEAEARFGFLLDAFRYGAPPHGGFGLGIDRFVAILAGEDNIREVIAFPKTQGGLDPLTGAPRPVDARVLEEVGVRVLPRPG